MPTRIQRKREKGWKLPIDAVCVDRSTKFGNPFPVDCYGNEEAVAKFRRWITGNMSGHEMSTSSRSDRWSNGGVSLVTVRQIVLADIEKLRGKNLACWCSADQTCHADVLLEIANQ